MIVMKFGGTSVESAAAIERVAGIVATRRRERPLVVVSAMGKTTDRLVEMSEAAAAGRRAKVQRLLAARRRVIGRRGRDETQHSVKELAGLLGVGPPPAPTT